MQRLFGRRYRSFESRNRVIYAAVSFVPAHFLGVGASVLALCRRLQERCSIYPVRFERHSGYVRSICAAQYSQRRQKENAVVNILRCIPDSSHPLRSGVPGDHSTFQRKVRKRVPYDQSKPTVGSASTPVLVAAITTTRELALR